MYLKIEIYGINSFIIVLFPFVCDTSLKYIDIFKSNKFWQLRKLLMTT